MTSRRLLTAEAKLLLDAADCIEKYGWCQGHAQDDKGRVCVLGAMVYGAASYEDWQRAIDKIIRQTNVLEIASWNDAPGRTMEEVVSMLRAAAIA